MREKKERNKQIIRKIKKGDYLVDIAKEFNVSPPMVSKIKRRYLIKVGRTNNKLTKLQ